MVGGGIAGICAALAAARGGLSVVLVQNRSLLGGNASSEIRQHIGGAGFQGHFPEAREAGIVGDLWSMLRRKCYRSNPNDYAESSVLFWDVCRRERNLRLFLNTQVLEVEKEGREIISICGLQGSTGKRFRFRAKQFADCSGDAVLAYLGGAKFLAGQEAREEFGESLAPPERSDFTMGNTILFQAEKLDCEVPAPDFEWIEDLRGREIWWTLHPPSAPMESGCWTFEYGGKLDTILDAEEIYEELLKIVYSAWADLKRRPECGMENYRISFLSAVPGKRESRRVIGDYILTQNDIVQTRRFEDDVLYAGWSLDLHNPDGFYGKTRPTTFYFFPEIHSVPLRCLYARDLDNLWLAGRDISVTHVALGGVRLMASCGLAGEAVGTAAVYFSKEGTCRGTSRNHIKSIQQDLLRNGGFIPGVRNQDPDDLARIAEVRATSEATLCTGEHSEWSPINDGVGIAFPVTAGKLETLTIWVKNESGSPSVLTARLQPLRTIRDFHPTEVLSEAQAVASAGVSTVEFALGANDLAEDIYMVHLFSERPDIHVSQTRSRVTGVHSADHFPHGPTNDPHGWGQELGMPNPPRWVRRFNPRRVTNPMDFHLTPRFAVHPASHCYRASNVKNGVNRPTRLPNLWASDPVDGLPQEISLHWGEPVLVEEVRLIFDADMDLAMPSREPVEVMAADYVIDVETEAGVRRLASVQANDRRMTVHSFAPVKTQALRISITRMNAGGSNARLCEIRCYGPQSRN
ncbi:MAG: hypothetical protein BGO12_03810 [Verrucomicrobia bacterium 61-8]|nr:MAG: hypothetical protein BGO12_03810 [Verrucomicrobia bacterium 61-8]